MTDIELPEFTQELISAITNYMQGPRNFGLWTKCRKAVEKYARSAVESDRKKMAKPAHEQNARFAIDGAIQYGRMGINKPPTEDHWLMEYWNIGQSLAQPAQENQSFSEWWENEGQFIDPDTSDVPWFDKRKELCSYAYQAGMATASASRRAAVPGLSFKIELRSGIWAIVEDDGGCRPATCAEIEMWVALNFAPDSQEKSDGR